VLAAGGQDLDVLLGPLVAHLHALGASVAARRTGRRLSTSRSAGKGAGVCRPAPREFGARAVVVDTTDDQAAGFYRHFDFHQLDDRRLWRDWRTSRAVLESRRPPLSTRSGHSPWIRAQFALLSAGLVAVDHWPRGVMTDSDRMARPDVLVAGGDELDGLLGPLAAYLDALEARVAALERRLSAVPLMTAADAARYARVNVETILRAVRASELSVAGYVGRSARISRDALDSWLAAKSSAAAASPPPRRRGRKASDAVEAAWQALG